MGTDMAVIIILRKVLSPVPYTYNSATRYLTFRRLWTHIVKLELTADGEATTRDDNCSLMKYYGSLLKLHFTSIFYAKFWFSRIVHRIVRTQQRRLLILVHYWHMHFIYYIFYWNVKSKESNEFKVIWDYFLKVTCYCNELLLSLCNLFL